MMKIILLSLLLSISFLFIDVHAQTQGECIEQPPKEQLANSDVVFTATILEVSEHKSDELGTLSKVRARVERYWKGIKTKETAFMVYLGGSAIIPTLFASMKEGERYLIYADRKETDGELFVSGCSRTRKIENAKEDIMQLGKGKKIR